MILLALCSLVFAMTAVLPKVMQHRIKNSGRSLLEAFIGLFLVSSFCRMSQQFTMLFIKSINLMGLWLSEIPMKGKI
ncbi:MAG: hypothetical protein EBU27_07730 [Opitutae bacterium]|nr:hypothetical protein [Opitutae bacterium]